MAGLPRLACRSTARAAWSIRVKSAERSGQIRRLIALTHVSNVTGTVQPIREIGQIAREASIPFIAGRGPIGRTSADRRSRRLCRSPGRAGAQGGFWVPWEQDSFIFDQGSKRVCAPLREGGTGSVSEQAVQPDFLPDRYEPGSHNAIGIAGLSEGVRWVAEQTVEKLAADELDLVRTFLEGVADIDDLKYFGPQGVKNRIGVFSVRIARA